MAFFRASAPDPVLLRALGPGARRHRGGPGAHARTGAQPLGVSGGSGLAIRPLADASNRTDRSRDQEISSRLHSCDQPRRSGHHRGHSGGAPRYAAGSVLAHQPARVRGAARGSHAGMGPARLARIGGAHGRELCDGPGVLVLRAQFGDFRAQPGTGRRAAPAHGKASRPHAPRH